VTVQAVIDEHPCAALIDSTSPGIDAGAIEPISPPAAWPQPREQQRENDLFTMSPSQARLLRLSAWYTRHQQKEQK